MVSNSKKVAQCDMEVDCLDDILAYKAMLVFLNYYHREFGVNIDIVIEDLAMRKVDTMNVQKMWQDALEKAIASVVDAWKVLNTGTNIMTASSNNSSEIANAFSSNGADSEGSSKAIESIDGLGFASKAAQHMDNPGRFVPVQTIREAIESTKAFPDPRGSLAEMHYTTMTKNGQTYNLEVLYDKATNTVYHFEYTRKAIGDLPAIPK